MGSSRGRPTYTCDNTASPVSAKVAEAPRRATHHHVQGFCGAIPASPIKLPTPVATAAEPPKTSWGWRGGGACESGTFFLAVAELALGALGTEHRRFWRLVVGEVSFPVASELVSLAAAVRATESGGR